MKKIYSSIILMLFFITVHASDSPHNIILLIGDGMGLSCVTAADVSVEKLNMERLNVGGFLKTYPKGKEIITDSAAAGTALATGHKTLNGMLALSPEGKKLESITEKAIKKGVKTGIVVSCSVTHATPASFLVHVKSRKQNLEIALQESQSEVDVLLGGGKSYFLPKEQGGKREDGKDLLYKMKKRGYSVITTPEELKELESRKGEKLIGLFSDKHMARAESRNPSLPEMTQIALEKLKNKKGFFLMVEGSQIDWANHANDSEWMIKELIDFDKAVGTAMDFAEKQGHTLVIVTADHETGGYALVGGSLNKNSVRANYIWNNHTASMVPLFAYGPDSEIFGGIHDNTFIGKEIKQIINAN